MKNLKSFFEELPRHNDALDVLDKSVTIEGRNLVNNEINVLKPNDIFKIHNFYVANSTVSEIPFLLNKNENYFKVIGEIEYDIFHYESFFNPFQSTTKVWLIDVFHPEI